MEYLKSKGIVPEAYSPFGSAGSPLLSDDVAVEIASKHAIKPADVLLVWLRTYYVRFLAWKTGIHVHNRYFSGLTDKKGCVVLPKSATPSRIDANLNGFIHALGKLDDSDIEKLDGVAASGKQKRFIMPPWGQSSFLSSVRFSYADGHHHRTTRSTRIR